MTKISDFFNFKNKIVVLTGCNGQLGAEISQMFVSNGAKVYGIDKIKNNKTINKNFFFKQINIAHQNNIENFIKNILIKEKKIDIIINNASHQVLSDINKKIPNKEFDFVKTNLFGAVNVIKSYTKLHNKNKSKFCSIINISSIYGVISPDFSIYNKGDRFSPEIYGASKAGLIQITKYFSVLLAKKNIIINSISPGGILNKDKQKKSFIKRYSDNVPMQRMASTRDMMTAILMFSSDYSKYTTGQNLIIDGGLTSK